MDRQKLEKANKLIKEIDKYEEVKDLVLMELIDVLVDGLYLEAERDLSLAFRGSGNQRIIDIKQSRLRNEPVIWRSKYDF